MVLNFNNFSKSRLVESDNYELVGADQTWNGGYKISVLDLTENNVDEIPRDRIIVAKKNETSIALAYMDQDGEESDYFWIPKNACKLVTDDSVGIKEILLDPYKKWISSSINRERFEDFVEDFKDSLESSKTTDQDRIKSSAQDDVEIILNLLGIPGEIESFDSYGDYIWDATLNNGMIVEITKRRPEDLLSKFKIFTNTNDREPCLFIDNSSSEKKTLFNISGLIKTNVPVGIFSSTNLDAYLSYLIKRAVNIQEVSDQEALANYFKSLIDSDPDNKELIHNISTLLEEFMDRKDVESLHPKA